VSALRVLTSPRVFLLLVGLALGACQPSIGDSCSNASDCSVQDQRTCDTTFPGGYCTVLGCGADDCPSEAACVGFQSVISVAAECASFQTRPRLQRSVCMLSCSKNSDCRGDYECVDMSLPNPWGAVVVDRSANGKVCALPPPPAPTGETAVCSAAGPSPGVTAPVLPGGALPDAGPDLDGSAP
jgi:hypothetical protein